MSALFSTLDRLSAELQLELPHIASARRRSIEMLNTLNPLVRDMVPADAAIVVFGSLARGEMTQGSDLDWTLLVDGQADHAHQTTALRIQAALVEAAKEHKFNPPNPSGAFGGVVFSHELVHVIGGNHDTNANLTLRMLLLLEAACMANEPVLRRVRSTVLARYFHEENFSPRRLAKGQYVPLFLLNDMIRFWRTMAVDYASKLSSRGKEKWALRNAKLRFSRKLLAASALLLCYEPQLNPPEEPGPIEGGRTVALLDRVEAVVGVPPLEILARGAALAIARNWVAADVVCNLFKSYDAFLGVLDDREWRSHLAGLPSDAVEGDDQFAKVREMSDLFRSALLTLFLESEGAIADLTRRYAIF